MTVSLLAPSQRAQAATQNAASTGERRYHNNPDFPLRRFVRCGSCDQPLTGSWCRSKTGRRYAYYHCHRCRTVSPRKEALEERFLELLDQLRPKTEYLEALRESVLAVWKQRKQDLEETRPILENRIAELEERKRRLVDAYVYEQAIDKQTYSTKLVRVSQDLTLVKVEHHGNEVDGLDFEAVLEFAEYVVLNSRRLWEEFPLDLRRRMQKVLFPRRPRLRRKGLSNPRNLPILQGLGAAGDRVGKGGSAYGIRTRVTGVRGFKQRSQASFSD